MKEAFYCSFPIGEHRTKQSGELKNEAATVNIHKQKSKVTRYLCSDVELWDSL